MKNIIICCDGTNNQLHGEWTNVVRLYQLATKNDDQVAYYDPGVGTLPDPVARTMVRKRWTMLTGLGFGAGFYEDVFDAYRYLMQVYKAGDKVFIFGFSRGAFTARVLAGMVHAVGLLQPGMENLLRYAYSYYRKAMMPEQVKACAELKRNWSRPCTVAFLGLWDTVSSIGMYNFNQTFPFTYENPSVEQVRHAVSLDERRAGFRSNVFKSDMTLLPDGSGRRRVMNVWFPGVHSDIGGGYAWNESGLAMISFAWMVREAKIAGMAVDESKLTEMLTGCPPNPLGKMHQSLKRLWWVVEVLPARRFNWTTKQTEWRWKPNKPRTMIETAMDPQSKVVLHESVLTRMSADPSYKPANLPSISVEELRTKFQIES